jgi:hypothetical protein
VLVGQSAQAPENLGSVRGYRTRPRSVRRTKPSDLARRAAPALSVRVQVESARPTRHRGAPVVRHERSGATFVQGADRSVAVLVTTEVRCASLQFGRRCSDDVARARPDAFERAPNVPSTLLPTAGFLSRLLPWCRDSRPLTYRSSCSISQHT